MTDDEEPERRHHFSEGQGFDEPYEGFDLDPPELDVDADEVDPVDSHVVADTLDERQVASDDVDADALVDVGLEYMGIKRFEQATEAFERAARYAEDDATKQEAWVNKGVAHAELEEWDDAIGAHEEALFIDDDGEFAADAHANLAYALWQFGEDEEAFRHAEEAVRTDQRHAQAWYNLGFIQTERANHEDAVECLDNALRLGFRNANVYEEKARALEGLGRVEEAEDAQERAEEIRERSEADMVHE